MQSKITQVFFFAFISSASHAELYNLVIKCTERSSLFPSYEKTQGCKVLCTLTFSFIAFVLESAILVIFYCINVSFGTIRMILGDINVLSLVSSYKVGRCAHLSLSTIFGTFSTILIEKNYNKKIHLWVRYSVLNTHLLKYFCNTVVSFMQNFRNYFPLLPFLILKQVDCHKFLGMSINSIAWLLWPKMQNTMNE